MKDARSGQPRGKQAISARLEDMIRMRQRELEKAQEQIAEEIRVLEAALAAAQEAI